MKSQIKSKHRVNEYGEVLTPKHIVYAMINIVKQECDRIDSRFLEPACGTGNFLIEILERKLRVVEVRYATSQLEYERYAALAVSSLYGIDILEDNVEECRKRLFETFNSAYMRLFRVKTKELCRESVHYILRKNIVHGDALSLKTIGENNKPIIFSEWSLVSGGMLKRRDFTFEELLNCSPIEGTNLFSDLGENAFIPRPLNDFPPVHFLEVTHAYDE